MDFASITKHSGLDGEEKRHLEKAVAWILSDSDFVQHVLFERYGPGNEYTAYGCHFKSPFAEFKHNGAGIGGSTGKTFISWLSGTVNGKTVIFIHPTSNLVDYREVRLVLQDMKDIPIITQERVSTDLLKLVSE